MDEKQRDRYARQIRLAQFGESGQQQILDASALIIGMGGLGSPAAMYLAASGIGKLVISDYDMVEASNLQRQIIHT
ncbi:MAG: ThiF family adenylyltransferase, partial [Gammaproteobacteria bacterium]|nr:ThiF family adenylyltransferase [Gammaproteobacteria bacterium]